MSVNASKSVYNISIQAGRTPLHLAAKSGSLMSVKFLIREGNAVNMQAKVWQYG
jgi:ankyrin repeat protein